MSSDPSSTAPKLQVAIAGGGIAGLITAIALLKHPGVSVQIYERAKELREIGASIGLGPNGLRSLEKLGVENALSSAVCQRQKSGWPMIYRSWKTGDVIDHDAHRTVGNEKHATARYHRAHLHQALLENLPRGIIHLNKKTINVHADSVDGVELFFEDGTSARADICIGADGIHSNVRKTFAPEHNIHWTGWVALRATFECSRLEGVDYPEDAAHWVGHDRNFFHSPLGKGLFTIVGGYHANPADPNAKGKDSQWNDSGSVEDFKELYKEWNPTVQALIQASPYVRVFPNYAGGPLETWSFNKRVTLVGDAAHTHGGAFAAGGSLAIDDAYALYLALNHIWPASSFASETLSPSKKPSIEDIASIFDLYERTRKPHINRILDMVQNGAAGKKVYMDKGRVETEDELAQRVLNRMDPWWISEHDVDAAFRDALGVGQVSGSEEEDSRPRL